MITGKTESGFEFQIEDYAMDNMELLDLLVDVDNGDRLAALKACNMLLGEEQKQKLYDHCRTEHGNVPMGTFASELTAIITSVNDGKK